MAELQMKIMVDRPKHGRMIKIYGRTPLTTVTVTVTLNNVHMYAPGSDMTAKDFKSLSFHVVNAILELDERNRSEVSNDTPSDA